ncbi:MAG: T9SS type A sorting domain-containing protein [bacterium]
MKKFVSLYCVAILVVLAVPVFSQNKTVFHYPLGNGDLWEYWEGPRFFIYEQRKVIGDSLLSNGKTYKAINITGNFSSGFKFLRIDDHCVFLAKPRFVPPDSTAFYEGGYLQLQGAIIDGRQFGKITSVKEPEKTSTLHIPVVTSFKIFPNPVASDAQVQFELTRPAEIQVSIFDVLGRQLYQSPWRRFGVGLHNLPWNSAAEFTKGSIPNGVYFIVLTENLSQQLVRKFIMMK